MVLAYWGQALQSPMAGMEARVAGTLGQLRRQRPPYAFIAGHQWDPAETQHVREALPQAMITVVPDSGHFPHLADPDRFAQLLAETRTVALGSPCPAWTDHRDGVATDYGPGVGWPEDRSTTHWLENREAIPAVEISIDIVSQE